MKPCPQEWRVRIGERLREARVRRGWSQTYVARRTGFTQRIVSFWERGERLPATEAMWELTQLYGFTFEELVGDVFRAPATRRLAS